MTPPPDATPLHRGFAELAWDIERARSGAPTLSLAGRAVHSRADPEAEARRIAAELVERARKGSASAFLLIGHGLGFVAEALARQSALPIVVLEPFAELAGALRATGCVRCEGRVVVARGIADFSRALDALGPAALRPVVHRQAGYLEPARFEARWLAGELRRRAGSTALDPRRAVTSARTLDALARLPERGSASVLASALDGATAFVISPGPSLAAALPALARRRGGIVIAALQALRPLVEAGVFVDVVVAPDPVHFAPFIEGVVPRFGVLLADAAAPPALLDRWPDRTALFSLRSLQLHHAAAERLDVLPLDEPFLTVSEICVVLAERFGAREIVQLGADFVSQDPRYAVRFDVRGEDGRPQPTNSHYFHGARDLGWRVPRLRERGVRFVRAAGGLPIDGAETLAPDGIAHVIAGARPLAEQERRRVESAARPPDDLVARRREVCAVLDEACEGAGSDARGPEALTASPCASDPRFADFEPLPAGRRESALRALRAEIAARG